LYLRSLDHDETPPIEGTAGAQAPFFSPDGEWIGFWADGRLQRVPIGGGTAATICSAPAEHGAAWLPDDTIVFSDGFGLQRVAVHEGHREPIAMPDTSEGETNYESPVTLPGGNAVIFSIRTNAPGDHRVAVLPLNNGRRTTLLKNADQPRFIAPAFVVVNRSGTLEVARFDTARLNVGPFRRLGEAASMAGAPSIA